MKIVGFAGSLRQDSYNKQLLAAVIELAPTELSIESIPIDDIPLFNADIETPQIPKAVEQFKQAIAEANGVIIISPEYSHTIPGVLKNALDWASREKSTAVFAKKPVAIGGATTGSWGTARAQLNIRLTLGAMGAMVMPLPHLYVPHAADVFTNGKLTDEGTKQHITAWLNGIRDFFPRFTS